MNCTTVTFVLLLVSGVISWSRRNDSLPSRHSVRDQGRVLSIPRFSKEDEGFYFCRDEETGRSLGFHVEILDIVFVRPEAELVSATDVIRAGETIRLECRDRNGVSDRIEWTRVGSALSASARQNGGVLTVPRATAADAGRYQCSVGAGGSAYAITEVAVHGKAVIYLHFHSFRYLQLFLLSYPSCLCSPTDRRRRAITDRTRRRRQHRASM